MKKIFILTFLFLSTAVLAQEKYTDIQGKVKAALKNYSTTDTNYKVLTTMLSNFEKAKKIGLSNFSKDNIGIAMVLSEEQPALLVWPAKYTFRNDMVNISAIRSKSTGGLTEDMKTYAYKYLHKMEEVGSTKLFRSLVFNKPQTEGTFTQNANEFIIDEPYSVSFVRGNEDWMYIVSIDNQYKTLDKPRIIIYTFKISISGNDIFNSGNSMEDMEKRRIARVENEKAEKEKFPLFHDFRTDDIRELLKELILKEPFKSNQELRKNIDQLDSKITRYNLKDYLPQFNYFLTLDFSTFKKKEQFEVNELLNIQHLSAHALADYYVSQADYNQAIIFYKKAAFTYPYEVSSGTSFVKDMERIIYDISKACYKAGRKDEAYGYLLGLIIDSQNNTDLATKNLKAYLLAEKEDHKKFRDDLDKAMKTIKADSKNHSRTFVFRNKEVFFYPLINESSATYQQRIKDSEFYKYLSQ